MKLVKFSHVIVTCVALAFTGVGFAQESQKQEEGKKEGQKISAMDKAWVKMAAMEDMAEIRMAKIAQEKATSEQLKQHAAQVLKDHTASSEELKKLAKEKDIELKTELPDAKKDLFEKFSSKSGNEFDQAYTAFEIAAHRMAVAHFQNGADFLKDQELQSFAQKQLPILEKHLSDAQQQAGKTTQTQPGQQPAAGTAGARPGAQPQQQQPGQVPPAQQQQQQPGQVQTQE